MTDKLYRTILIDPEKQSITTMQTTGDLKAIEDLVAPPSGGLDRVDDTGLAAGQPVPAFLLSIRKDPIAGRCVLIGAHKDDGVTTDAQFNLNILREVITWLGEIKPEVVWDHTETGDRAIVIYERVNNQSGTR